MCVDVIALDELQCFLGIEPFHRDHRAAHLVYRHAEAQRCRVIQRRGRQVDHGVGEAEQQLPEHA